MRSTFLPFSPPLLGEEEINEVIDTLRSDWITTGPKVRRFEERFAELIGAPGALAVSSCTDALQVALAAIGVGPGDAVFTTTMTFCATAHVAEHLGATPVLVDVERDTLNLDPLLLEHAIDRVIAEGRLTPRAIIPVHFSGHPCEMGPIFDLARRHGLAVIEDAAHALPARTGDLTIGAIRDDIQHAVAFSFYATKNLTTGEGGMLTAGPDLLAECRLWSLHGMSKDAWKRYDKGGSWQYEVIRPGFKCNMTDMQAALGLRQIDRLPSMQQRRAEVSAKYADGFVGLPIEVPIVRPGVSTARHLFVIRLDLARLSIDRAQFIDELTARNIGTSVHFIPLHLHPFYRDKYTLKAADFPVADHEFTRMISLPLNPRLTDADVDDVIEAVRDVCETHAI
jgi:dTDP-4-amino-4,6-dideoxygalactose transaminase